MLAEPARGRAALRLCLALFVLLCATMAHAQSFPKLTGRVVDQAHLLSAADEAALSRRLAVLEEQSSRQLVVVTLPDLQGYDIADYGYQLGRHWGIGQSGAAGGEKDNGALLIVAPNERKVRIEVGYGLEGILTDALSSLIIQQDILPRFRDGDYPGGIAAGTDALINQLALPEDEARAYAKTVADKARRSSGGDNAGLIIFWLVVILLFFVIPAIRAARGGGRRYRGRSGAGPIIIWGGGSDWGSSGGSSWGSGGGFGGGGFSGGGGSFGGGGASGGW